MTKIKTLKNWNEDHTKRESIAPRTHIKAVYDNNGNTLDSLMAVQDEKLSELGSKVDSVQKNMEQDIYQEFVDVEKNNYYGEYAINSLGEISSNSDCSTYRIPVKEGDTISI